MSEIQGNIVQIKRTRNHQINNLSQLQEGELACMIYSDVDVPHDPGAHGQLYIGGKVLEPQEGAESKEVLKNLPISPKYSYQSHRAQMILDNRETETEKELFYSDVIADIKKEVFKSIYPIGAIYITLNQTNPGTVFGGTWEQIEGKFLLSASSAYTAGSTGGEETVTLTKDKMPKHSHTRGTMNIEGTFRINSDSQNAGVDAPMTGTGAITGVAVKGYGSAVDPGGYGEWGLGGGFDFDASKSWTGETSEEGGDQPHNNMPPYLAVYMWKRTA